VRPCLLGGGGLSVAIFGRRKAPLSQSAQPSTDDFDSVLTAALDGTLPVEAACQRAAELGASAAVSAQQLSDWSLWWFRRCTVEPEAAWSAARVLNAAADAAWTRQPDSQSARALVQVCADLVAAATAGLAQAGDIRQFVIARSAAERGIAVAAQLQWPGPRAVLLERLGRMILQCYVVRRSPSNYEADFRAWECRAVSKGDPELLAIRNARIGDAGDGRADYRWPDALEAVSQAEEYLREALSQVDRRHAGQVRKALAQALQWRGILGGVADPAGVIELCEQALAELPPGDLLNQLVVLRMLEADRGPAATGFGSQAQRLDPRSEAVILRLENDWDAFASVSVPVQAWDAVTEAAALLAEVDSARALRLLDRHRDLESLWADGSRRRLHWQLVIGSLAGGRSAASVSPLWESEEQFAATATRLLTLAPGPDLSVSDLSGPDLEVALTNVMLASLAFEREDVGVQVLAALARLGGPNWAAHAEAYRNLDALLRINEGGNCESRGEADAAIGHFLAAASRFLALGAPADVVDSLNRISHVMASGHQLTRLRDVTLWCAQNALPTELLSPQAGPQILQPLVDAVLAYQMQHGTGAEEVYLLMAGAAGRRFAMLLASGTTGFAPEPEVVRLLAEIAAAEQLLPPDHPLLGLPDWADPLNRDLLLTAYVSEFEQSPSATAEDDIVNHQRAAERRLMAQLAAPHARAGLPIMLADLQAALDSRTALLLLREGMWTAEQGAVYSLLVTDTAAYPGATSLEIPWGVHHASAGGRAAQVPASGVYVAGLRRAVQEEPAPANVSSQGRQLLEAAGMPYARALQPRLAELRAAGRDRLLVLPHRASRFLPLHLAGPPDHLLADDWAVTYLASLAQLTEAGGSRTAAQRPRREGAAVFALGYADQPGLPTLDCSAAEAEAIGSILGVQPVLDGAATEQAFVRALESRRYVHLRAHGRHNVDAPLFQTVFLAPGDGDDGRLRAHEVLGLDLRGLELVTLGACETALGRIDYSDNLRGLPAALLLAGADAVIGTLWEVAAEASTTFFTELYRCLSAGGGDLIGAFRQAQQATRAQHSEYRDWGAFYLTGGYQRSSQRP
jgi:CHAT domain-containing protein